MNVFKVLVSFVFINSVWGNIELNKNITSKTSTAEELCNQQLNHFRENLDRKVLWARKLRDSWGNVPSGIISGNLYDFGSFDQCINFKHQSTEVGDILGQHCTLLIPYDRNDVENQFNAKFMPPTRNPDVNVGIGVCVPASCNPDNGMEISVEILKTEFNVTSAHIAFCSKTRKPFEFDGLQIFAM